MTKTTMIRLASTLALSAAALTISAARAHVAQNASATVAAEIKDAAFAPARIEVAPGTTIEWTNRDPMQHSVTARDSSFDSGLLDPERKYSHTFDSAGTYELFCAPHPFMRATVVVR